MKSLLLEGLPRAPGYDLAEWVRLFTVRNTNKSRRGMPGDSQRTKHRALAAKTRGRRWRSGHPLVWNKVTMEEQWLNVRSADLNHFLCCFRRKVFQICDTSGDIGSGKKNRLLFLIWLFKQAQWNWWRPARCSKRWSQLDIWYAIGTSF